MTDSQDLQQGLQQENEALRQRIAVLEGRLVQAGEGMVRLLSVLENSLDAAYRRDLRTDSYDYMSPVIEQITGWSADEMCSMDIQTVMGCIHPEDVSAVQQVIEATQAECGAAGRATGILEYRFRGKDGAYRWLADSVTVLAGGDGAPLYRLGSVRDISQRKLAEAQLRDSEERFRGLFEHMLDGFAYCQMLYENGRPVDFLYLAVNDAFERLTGLKDVVGKRVSQVIPGVQQDNPELFEIYGRVAAGGAPVRFETHLAALDLWLSVSVYSPGTGYFVAVFDNITQRKRAEERLELATRSARLGIWDWDIQKNELAWDEGMYRLYGLQPGQFGGAYEAWLHGVHPEDREASDRLSEQVRRGDGVYDTEFRVVWPDGSVHWLKADGQVYRDAAGSAVRMIGINADLTARKHMEQELRHALDELRSSNADLEEFAYAASHDLQEPLRVVSGMLQLLQQRYGGCLDDRADEYIRHAVDASERMQALIRDLLQYSRLGRRSLALVSFPLQQALDAALANLRVSVEEAGAQVTQDELPSVRADQAQIVQLLQNLVGNALKFHGARPPQIHIGALRLAGGWRFSVSDNGIGIEPQYYERIFQVFQRLHTRSEYPGTGIGLALCKKIVERHGGRIWVESQVGQGSSFYFTLPAEG
jgi:PAS domain S-box-containing protein